MQKGCFHSRNVQDILLRKELGNRISLPNLKLPNLNASKPIPYQGCHKIHIFLLCILFRTSDIRCRTLSDPSASASVKHEWAGVVGGSHGSVGCHHLCSIGGRSVRGDFIITRDRRDRSDWSRVTREWRPASIDIVGR